MLRGGSYQGMDDADGSDNSRFESAEIQLEELPAGAELVRHKRVNRTAMDAMLYNGVSSTLLADQIDEASALAAAGVDIEEIDRQVDVTIEQLAGVDFTGKALDRR